MKFYEFINTPAAAFIVGCAMCLIALAYVICFRIDSKRRKSVAEVKAKYEEIVLLKERRIRDLEAEKNANGARWFDEYMRHQRTQKALDSATYKIKQFTKAEEKHENNSISDKR